MNSPRAAQCSSGGKVQLWGTKCKKKGKNSSGSFSVFTSEPLLHVLIPGGQVCFGWKQAQGHTYPSKLDSTSYSCHLEQQEIISKPIAKMASHLWFWGLVAEVLRRTMWAADKRPGTHLLLCLFNQHLWPFCVRCDTHCSSPSTLCPIGRPWISRKGKGKSKVKWDMISIQ